MEVALFCQEWKQRCHPFQSQWHLFDIEAHQMEDVLNLRSIIWHLHAWGRTSAMCPVCSCVLMEKIWWVSSETLTCKCRNGADSMICQCSVFYLKTNNETWSHWEDGFFSNEILHVKGEVPKKKKKCNSAMLPSFIWMRNRPVVLRNEICFFSSVSVMAFSAIWAKTIISSQSVWSQFCFFALLCGSEPEGEMPSSANMEIQKMAARNNCSTGRLCIGMHYFIFPIIKTVWPLSWNFNELIAFNLLLVSTLTLSVTFFSAY